MSRMQFAAQIAGQREAIFELIADMPNYGRWLPGSDAFGATTEVTPYPVQLGTTYVDGGPAGPRPGSVTRFEPPSAIAFHQTMRIERGPLRADADIRIHYSFTAIAGGTRVVRDLELTIEMPWWQRLAAPLIRAAFRKENVRLLAELKRHVERA